MQVLRDFLAHRDSAYAMRRNRLLIVAVLFVVINTVRCEEDDASMEAKDQPKKKRVPPSVDAGKLRAKAYVLSYRKLLFPGT